MENWAAFNARKVKRAATEEGERSIRLQKGNENESTRQSHPNEVSKNCKKGAEEWKKMDSKKNWEVFRTQVLKHLPGEREEITREMSGGERLPGDRLKRLRVLGSLRRRSSKEITLMNTSSPRGSEVSFESQRG